MPVLQTEYEGSAETVRTDATEGAESVEVTAKEVQIGGEPISQPLELPDLPVRYNPNLKNEASNKGVHIEVGDKFYKL